MWKADYNFKLGHQNNFHCKGKNEKDLERKEIKSFQAKERVCAKALRWAHV